MYIMNEPTSDETVICGTKEVDRLKLTGFAIVSAFQYIFLR